MVKINKNQILKKAQKTDSNYTKGRINSRILNINKIKNNYNSNNILNNNKIVKSYKMIKVVI